MTITEDDVREAIRRERERWESTITHPDAVDAVMARLREVRAEQVRAIGDARLVGAEGNRDPLGVMRAGANAALEPCCYANAFGNNCYHPNKGTPTPAPAEMLAEALALLDRVEALVRDGVMQSRGSGVEPVTALALLSNLRAYVVSSHDYAKARHGR